MPEVDTYSFKHKELLAILIKEAGVHDGEWMLLMNLNFQAGNFGPDDENMNPGSMALVTAIGITRAKKASPKALVLDAANVNPA